MFSVPGAILQHLRGYSIRFVVAVLWISNLKIIPDSRIRNIVSKGAKYRFHFLIAFNRCKEAIASALNDLGNRWCKRESVKCNALKE